MASCVVIQHTGQQIINVYYPNKQHFLKDHKLYYIELAVAVFIVVSGLVMYLSMTRETITAKKFILNRFTRIYPLYFIMTVACFLIYKMDGRQNLGIWELFKSLLFINKQPLLGVAWSLNIEVYFYILCFFALLIHRKKAKQILLAFLVCILAAEVYWLFFPLKMNIPIIYSFTYYKTIVIYFIIGIFLGYLYKKEYFLKPRTHLFLVIFGAILGYLLTFSNAQEYWTIYFSFPAFLVAYGCLGISISKRHTRIADYLGCLSYSMYLSHWLTIFLVGKIVGVTKFYHVSSIAYVNYGSVYFLTFLLSMLLYKYIEVPSSKMLKRIFRQNSTRKISVSSSM